MKDLFFYEAFLEEEAFIRRFLPDGISAGFSADTIQEVGHKSLPAKIISIRTQSIVPELWIGSLNAILSRSSGFDHIKKYADIIPCGYLPVYSHIAVAEQAMLMWMSLMRKFNKQQRHFSSFNRDNLTGFENRGKTISIFGVGNIGYEIYKIAKNLGMKALGIDIVKKYPDVYYVSKDSGIKSADIIVCAMNLTKDNRNYFDFEALRQTKSGTFFVNVSRGELSSLSGLLKLINEKHLGGVALDVYENEPVIGECLRNKRTGDIIDLVMELKSKENVILTPHNAFNTIEAVERKSEQSIRQIESFMKHNKFLWSVSV